MGDIALALVMAAIGAVTGIVLQAQIKGRRYRRLDQLLGPWMSSYQTLDSNERVWTSEAVTLDVYNGHLRITNSNNSRGFGYVAVGELIDEKFLHGEWESKKATASEQGVHILTISDDRKVIYGYWSGKNETESNQYVGWVLAKHEPDLEKGRRDLQNASQTFPLAGAAA